ncbi:MAG: 1-deoxy-D-xylulose-5-phosphate synthase [Planctomycetes bacterium]|nr:1-deoxy-D-xylulose-5-phosphate synthase [Planctomycetota bacterium]
MGQLLENIQSPTDLKGLSVGQLKGLAKEIREFILQSLSKTGGHLASNLGAVELTLALHYVFDFEQDRLCWDVGHQCYTHKIITGRRAQFDKLRQRGGVSGFPDPSESPYDHFKVGHAGTAISTGIGLALGEQLVEKTQGCEKRRNVVSLVGDASIVNGNSFEGLNNLGLVKRQMLIVLNDNNMAIDVTVGSLAKYFARVRLSHPYEDIRKITKAMLEHVPKIGRSMEGAVERVKKQIRMVLPASQLFEAMNVPYFGPVDGHDIESLVLLFRALEDLDHPVLLHAHTQKGEGFSPAQTGPSKFHSCGPFNKVNGDTVKAPDKTGPVTYTEAFGQSLVSLAQADDRVVAMTSAMCDGTGLNPFRERFPDRFFDVGIAESTAVDIAAGLAHSGYRPVVCIYSTFLQRSFDQIFQEVALQNLPVVFCVDRAGFVGPDGPTHHGMMDIGYLRMMPNVILIAPATASDMQHALGFALQQSQPVVIRYPKDTVVSDEGLEGTCDTPFELGKSVVVKSLDQVGVVLLAYGSTLGAALAANALLKDKGIHVGVVNARFASPMDTDTLEWLRQGKQILTLEDHCVAGGFGSALLEMSAMDPTLPAHTIRVAGAPKSFMPHHLRAEQLMEVGLNADDIARTAIEMLKA